MESICTSCARVALRPHRNVARAVLQLPNRTFSTTTSTREDDNSRNPVSSSSPASPQRPSNPQRSTPGSTQADRPGGLVIRREMVDGPPIRQQRPQTQGGNFPIRRTGAPQGGAILRRAPGAASPQGQLLRRTGGAPQTGSFRRPGGPGRGQGQQTQGGQSQQGLQRKRRRAIDRPRTNEDEAGAPTEAEIDDYVTKYIDRPENPTEPVTYNPTPQSAKELQKDWPNTPLSSIGLTASVVQKIEWLARRIPHGYQTPEQLADHYFKGNLTRFESEEEKKTVIKIAQDIANKQAEKLTEKKGNQFEPREMSVVDLSTSSDDRKSFVDSMVRGEYTELEKQRMPFLDNVVKILRNNSTYHSTETNKFMAKVQSMMPAQGVRRPAQARKAA